MDLKEVEKQYELTGNFWNIKVMGEGIGHARGGAAQRESHSEALICFAFFSALPFHPMTYLFLSILMSAFPVLSIKC